jgi:hypothetical protein
MKLFIMRESPAYSVLDTPVVRNDEQNGDGEVSKSPSSEARIGDRTVDSTGELTVLVAVPPVGWHAGARHTPPQI